MSDIVLCKDCKHSQANWFNRMIDNQHAFKCVHPDSWQIPRENRVTGKNPPGYFQSCSAMRVGLSDTCGQEGKLWAPRHKRDLFKYINHVGTL
jgi:hypothetical protein